MPVDLIVTNGTTSDSSQVNKLISEIERQYLLADRRYDTNGVLEIANSKRMEVVIPPKGTVKINENTIKRYMRTATKWKTLF